MWLTVIFTNSYKQHDDPLEKISDFVDTVSEEMSNICNCYVPADHFGDMRLVCHEESPNTVILQGRVIIIRTRNASELMEYLAQWVSAAPHVIVQGVQLVTAKNCSVKLSELGNYECMMSKAEMDMKQTKLSHNNSEADELPLVPIGLGIVSTVVLVAVIILATCGILVLRKKKM